MIILSLSNLLLIVLYWVAKIDKIQSWLSNNLNGVYTRLGKRKNAHETCLFQNVNVTEVSLQLLRKV